MPSRRAAAALVAGTGAVAALALGAGVYAASVVPLDDTSAGVVAGGAADAGCTQTAMGIASGLARFDDVAAAFVVHDVTVSAIPTACAGLHATVVGLAADGVPVVQGAAVAASPAFTVTLSNGFVPGDVASWRIVLQSASGDAGTTVHPPSLVGSPIPAEPGPTASASPNASGTAMPSDPATPEPSAASTPEASDPATPEPSAAPPSAAPEPSSSPEPTPSPTPQTPAPPVPEPSAPSATDPA